MEVEAHVTEMLNGTGASDGGCEGASAAGGRCIDVYRCIERGSRHDDNGGDGKNEEADGDDNGNDGEGDAADDNADGDGGEDEDADGDDDDGDDEDSDVDSGHKGDDCVDEDADG